MSILQKLYVLCFAILFSAVSYAQSDKIEIKLNHPVNPGKQISSAPKSFFSGIDSVKIVAVLVQFQEDNDERTTGNGRFDMSNKYYNPTTQKDTIIDSPPYDSAYFADHLLFLKNYYKKSSKGKLNINFELFGQIITLPGNMQSYSPQSGEGNEKLGNLFRDSWARADSFINFSGYDLTRTAFVIFHAGTGRDVDVSSILGFDPTPYDIPSVFLGLKSLKEIYGQSYNGFQTNDGVFIQNSLIIPSTELRELDLISGNFLIELGMNGILCASFGSYLGLPDLFNTSNGKTAIGRFGLMDGQSLFSYNGIFPPEPSAWEKIFLGWVSPVVIPSGSGNLRLPAISKNIQRDSTILKILINSKEYFLIENRNRDPEYNGQTIYYRNRNFVDSTIYAADMENGFYYSSTYTDLSLLSGNIRDVENFDWSLPGLINGENNYRGGILIWHIDENVIDANIASNSINNNSQHKGVDLEEAKGAQEIGVTFNTPFGSITGDGTPVDYWFNGSHQVPTSVYKNEFTPSSIPNSLSYSLANNNISLKGFTIIDTLMNFDLNIGSVQISPIKGFPINIGIDSTGNSQAIAFDFIETSSDEIFANSNNKVFAYRHDGSPVTTDGILISDYGKYIPAFVFDGTQNYVTAVRDQGVIFKSQALGSVQYSLTTPYISCPPFINKSNSFAYIGKSNGAVYRFSPFSSGGVIDSVSDLIKQFSGTASDTFNFITNFNKFIITGNITSPTSADVLLINNQNELILNGSKINLNYSLNSINSSPVLADINSDGRQEIIFSADNKIYALNQNGVLLDNFPVASASGISSGISVCDVNNDNVYDLIYVSSDGNLNAVGVNGKPVSGFPISIGINTVSTPALANLNDTLGIIVAGGDGYLYGFKTNTVYNENKILWKNFLKDKYLSNNNFVSGSSPSNITDKLPSDKVYNWPNPVYDNETFIRYYLNGSSSGVTIKILDLSGELVTTLNGTNYSKSDNEVIWNVSDVQSGIYYGVIEADIDGSKETRIIKIAVVK